MFVWEYRGAGAFALESLTLKKQFSFSIKFQLINLHVNLRWTIVMWEVSYFHPCKVENEDSRALPTADFRAVFTVKQVFCIYIYRCQMWGCLKNLWMKSTIFPQDGQSWLICTDVRMALAVACAVLARCGGRTGGSQSHFWPIRDSVSAHRNKLTDSNGNFLYLGMVEFAASLFTKKIPKGTIE